MAKKDVYKIIFSTSIYHYDTNWHVDFVEDDGTIKRKSFFDGKEAKKIFNRYVKKGYIHTPNKDMIGHILTRPKNV